MTLDADAPFTVAGLRLSRRTPGGRWHAAGLIGGRRVRRTTGTADPTQAAELVRIWVANGVASQRPAKRRTLAHLAARIIQERELGSIHPATAKAYLEKVDLLRTYLRTLPGHERPLARLTRADIEGYVAWRQRTLINPSGRGAGARLPGPRTLDNDLDHLRAVFRRGVALGWLAGDPTQGVPRSRFARQPRIRSLAPTEVDALFRSLAAVMAEPGRRVPAPLLPMLQVILGCGLRREEARLLERRDILLSERVLRVAPKRLRVWLVLPMTRDRWRRLREARDGGRRSKGVRLPAGVDHQDLQEAWYDDATAVLGVPKTWDWQPKAGAVERLVPIPEGLLEALRTWLERPLTDWYSAEGPCCHREQWGLEPTPFLFPARDGGPLHCSFHGFMGRAAKRIGLARPRIHDLRHTYATWLRQGGAEMTTIQHLLGHQDIKTTMVYAPYSLQEGRQAVARLPWFGQPAGR